VVNFWLWRVAIVSACLINAKLENVAEARGIATAIVAASVEAEKFIIVMKKA